MDGWIEERKQRRGMAAAEEMNAVEEYKLLVELVGVMSSRCQNSTLETRVANRDLES
jgi:hypothetical protein